MAYVVEWLLAVTAHVRVSGYSASPAPAITVTIVTCSWPRPQHGGGRQHRDAVAALRLSPALGGAAVLVSPLQALLVVRRCVGTHTTTALSSPPVGVPTAGLVGEDGQ